MRSTGFSSSPCVDELSCNGTVSHVVFSQDEFPSSNEQWDEQDMQGLSSEHIQTSPAVMETIDWTEYLEDTTGTLLVHKDEAYSSADHALEAYPSASLAISRHSEAPWGQKSAAGHLGACLSLASMQQERSKLHQDMQEAIAWERSEWLYEHECERSAWQAKTLSLEARLAALEQAQVGSTGLLTLDGGVTAGPIGVPGQHGRLQSISVIRNSTTSLVLALAVNSAGSKVFSGSSDGMIAVWEGGTHALLGVLEGHEGWVLCLAAWEDNLFSGCVT